MTGHTKRALDAAIDELKREGYMILIMLCDKRTDKKLGDSLEVLCSETNNPLILREWAKHALQEISRAPEDAPERIIH